MIGSSSTSPLEVDPRRRNTEPHTRRVLGAMTTAVFATSKHAAGSHLGPALAVCSDLILPKLRQDLGRPEHLVCGSGGREA